MVADRRADRESMVFCWGSISVIMGWTKRDA